MDTKLIKIMFVRAMYIMIILAMAFPATGSASAEEPALPEGWHDGPDGIVNAASCGAFGWAVDPDDPDMDLQVQIVADGSPVATTTADLLREDVDACTGGTCGFGVNLWGLISAGVEHTIRAQAYDKETATWVDLEGTPKTLTCWGYPEGFHDGNEGVVDANSCTAFGWAADPDDRDRELQVQILADGNSVATVTADLLRPDVSACTEGTCGFDVNLWGLISPDEEHQIASQAFDVETGEWFNLEATPKTLTCQIPPPPNPFIAVSLTERWFWVNNFMPETLVTFSIYDYQGDENPILEFSRPTDALGNLTIEGWAHIWNPEPGDYIVATDGFNMKDLVLEYVTLDVFDTENDLVSGHALPSREVGVGVGNETGEQWMNVFTDVSTGIWVADFTLEGFEFDITDDSWAGGHVNDEDGDVTAAHNSDPPEPPAWFTAFPEQDVVEGWNWPLGAVVHLAIDDPTTAGVSPDYEQDEKVTFTPWGSWELWVWFDFAGGYDMKAGDIVTLTYGETVRTHIVQNLAVTKVNQEDNIVKGIADAGAEVYVWPHATGQEQLAITNPRGKWNVDFTGIYDLAPGDGGRARIWDEMGNATEINWNIPNPRLVAFPAVDQIFGYYWPKDSIVNLKINGKHIAKATVQGAPWDPNDIMAFFDFGGLHDLVAGDVVMLSGHDMELTYTVQNLTVTEVNESANTVTGTADPGSVVMVYPFDYSNQSLNVTADENGDWFANFVGTDIDLVLGMCGRSDIFDEYTNSTTVDWCVPWPLTE